MAVAVKLMVVVGGGGVWWVRDKKEAGGGGVYGGSLGRRAERSHYAAGLKADIR